MIIIEGPSKNAGYLWDSRSNIAMQVHAVQNGEGGEVLPVGNADREGEISFLKVAEERERLLGETKLDLEKQKEVRLEKILELGIGDNISRLCIVSIQNEGLELDLGDRISRLYVASKQNEGLPWVIYSEQNGSFGIHLGKKRNSFAQNLHI